jgi:tetratricopeptide (TPR) repeat protein
MAIMLLLGASSWHAVQQHQYARAALREGREHIANRDYEQAASALQRGIALADGIPFSAGLMRELNEQLGGVQDHQAAREFHLCVDRIRLLVGVDALPAPEARAVEDRCRALWNERERVAALSEPTDEPRHDLLDMAILWTRLRVRLALADNMVATRREALEILAEAERLGGPSSVLYRERELHANALGLKENAQDYARQAAAYPPRTAWEYAALGRILFDGGDPEGAARQFDRALELRPDDFWASFHKGRCTRLLGRLEEAVTAFTVCLALAPESAWCHYNRALALVDGSHLDRARRDFDRALQLDATLADAHLHRGLLDYREGKYDAAVADLRRALAVGANPATVHYALALVHQAGGNLTAAESELLETLRHDPNHKAARALHERLQPPG